MSLISWTLRCRLILFLLFMLLLLLLLIYFALKQQWSTCFSTNILLSCCFFLSKFELLQIQSIALACLFLFITNLWDSFWSLSARISHWYSTTRSYRFISQRIDTAILKRASFLSFQLLGWMMGIIDVIVDFLWFVLLLTQMVFFTESIELSINLFEILMRETLAVDTATFHWFIQWCNRVSFVTATSIDFPSWILTKH